MAALVTLLRFISVPEIRARPIRALLMAGTVAVGVALLTAMHVATESIVTGYSADLERLSGRADLQVAFGTGETGFSEDVLAKVLSQPSVLQAAALVRGQVTFEEGASETVEFFGIDVLQKDVLDLYEVKVLDREKDDFTILNDPRGIFVTDVIAKERKLAVGARTRLSSVDGVHEYTVRGVVASTGLAAFLGGRLVAMYLPAAQPVVGRRGDLAMSIIDQLDVRLKEGSDPTDAAHQLSALLGPGFRVETPIQRRLAGEHTVEGLRATLVGMSSLALLAALFIVYASTTTMVTQRLASMGTLVSIGAPPAVLVRAVVVEAGFLGLVGAVAGTFVGLALASFVGEDAAAGMGLNYSLTFDSARVAWNPFVVFLWHPLGGVLAAGASAFAPARRLRSATPLALVEDFEEASANRNEPLYVSTTVGVVLAIVGGALLVHGVPSRSPEEVSAGGIAFIAASVFCALPVLRMIWKLAAPQLLRRRGISGRLACENLLRSMDRSLVTASAITLSVAIAVGAGSLVRSFRASVADWYGFSGDALVSAKSVNGGWLASPVNSDAEAMLEELSSVASVETLRVLQGQPYHGERIAVVGLSDELLDTALSRGSIVTGDSDEQALDALRSGQGAAVSRNFVTHFGLGPSVSVSTPTGELDLPVVAVIPDYVSDQGSVILGRHVLAKRWSDVLVNYYAVTLADGGTIPQLTSDLRGATGSSSALVVTSTRSMIERVDGLIGQAFADIDTIKLLVLFLTIIGIGDLVTSNILSRKRELGVLRLVGLTERQVVQSSFWESLVVTVGAALCGALIGILCAWLWVGYNYPVLVGYVLELNVSWESIFLSILLAILSASIAAIVAAKYSLRQPALQALRFE